MPELGNPFRLGEWEVDTARGDLHRGEIRRHLEPRNMAVLEHLARHAGQVISKDELMATVWADACVGEESVWRSISSLRRALGDDGSKPRFIATIPKRGYLLVAPVEPLEHLETRPSIARVKPVRAPSTAASILWRSAVGAVLLSGTFLLVGGYRIFWTCPVSN